MTNLYRPIVSFTAVLLAASQACARPLTPDAALARINNSTQVNYRIKKSANKMQLVHTMTVGTVPTVYIYNQQHDGGFLILSADDIAPAILGYSDSGTINPDNLPPGLNEWMSDLSADIGLIAGSTGKVRTAPAPDNAWDDIGPMLTTTWDQDAPYNNLCPSNGSGGHCLTGCAATAMAQIMNYHKWPKQGAGSNRYYLSTKRKYLEVDFSKTTYDWEHMADHYGAQNYVYDQTQGQWYAEPVENTNEENSAVATLMYHLGVAVNMKYGNSCSTAATNAFVQNDVLVNHFGYDQGITFVERDVQYSGQDDMWEQLIYNELAAGRPVFYTGRSESEGGHGFVCDGYKKEVGADGNTRNYFHFNWGWSGIGNGYYLVTAFYNDNDSVMLLPENCFGKDGVRFSQNQSAIIGICPDRGDYLYSNGTPTLLDAEGNTVTEPVSGEHYTLSLPIINGSTHEAEYYLGAELYNNELQSSQYIMSSSPVTLQPQQSVTDIDITWPENSADGDYDIFPCYSTTTDASTIARIELPDGAESPTVVYSNAFDFYDGTNFDLAEDRYYSSVTYHRKFYANVWNSWYLPFAVNTDELAENHLTAACVNGIHQYDDDNDGVYERTTVELLKIQNGTLRAATPYFVKPDDAYSNIVELGARTVTKASTMHSVHTETAYAKYDFIGTYTKKMDGNEQKCFIMARDGGLKITSSYVPAVDWYMQISEKESPFDAYTPVAATSKVVITLIGEEDEATGIRTIYDEHSPKRVSEEFTLQGTPAGKGYKGIVIKNGKKMLMK